MGTDRNSDAGDTAFTTDASTSEAGDMLGDMNGGSHGISTAVRRPTTPMKRVASRVPVDDVVDQPLLEQAKALLNDQKKQ